MERDDPYKDALALNRLLSLQDILVLFSKSGATEELTKLAPYAKAKGAYLVAVTSCQDSKLGRICNMHVHLPLEREVRIKSVFRGSLCGIDMLLALGSSKAAVL